MEDNENGNIIETALAAGTAMAKPITNPHKGGRDAMLVPHGMNLEYMERPELPHRKDGTVKLNDADSFIAYWKAESSGVSRVYGSMEPKAQFVAVLNDHSTTPNWKDYRALYTLRHSKEWETWMQSNAKPFAGNEAFAVWLEDNAIDITNPTPARMMDVALNMRVNQAQSFASATRLQDGQVELAYSNVVDGQAKAADEKKIKIPEEFSITIPVFEGLSAPKYKIDARFRYRMSRGALSVWYQLIRPQKVIEQAFTELVKRIEKDTKAVVLFGTPE